MSREENLRSFMRDSHAVDEAGDPLRLYHGTADDFSEFRLHSANKKDAGWLGRGFYFTNSPSLANSYSMIKTGKSPNVMPVHLALKNPFYATQEHKTAIKNALMEDPFAADDFRNQLLDAGHDGVILDYGTKDNVKEYVAFHPEQIKSATGNQGTFDPSNPDITKAQGGEVEDDGITAYHGTPHEFEQFDLSKIGTGEGAQAYGHGLYFAEREDIAKDYRDRLSGAVQYEIGGKDAAQLYDEALNKNRYVDAEILENIQLHRSPHDLRDQFSEENGYGPEYRQALERILPNLKEVTPGHMYEVRINAHPDHFLDWDKPLTEQPYALRALWNGPDYMRDIVRKHAGSEATYGNLHGLLSVKHPSGQQGLSDHLREAGIKGIKYFDAGSRGDADKPTRNYVVFDDKLVNVRRRYERGGKIDETGDRYERSQEGPFYRLARKDLAGDRRVSEGLRPEVREAAGADPRGAGEVGRGDPALSAPGQAPGVESVPHRIARDYVRNVHGRDLVAPNLDSSLTKQSAIGRSFAEAVKGAPEYKAAIFDAYARMMPEVVEQSGATNYDQLLERAYRQMAQETSQQFETLPFRMSFHRAGEGDYPTSKHMLDDLHNNNHLYVFQGGDPHEFLHNVDPETGLNENEKFRAVHDVFGHGIYGNPFGAKGEENAWATHSQMYSPLARLAMTAETRGQNSFVNYTPINALLKEKIAEVEEKIADARRSRNEYSMQSALKKKGDLYKQFQFAPQKSVLLPPEFLDPEYKGGMPEYMRPVIKPEPGTGFSSALTHYSTVPDMERTDPSRYGTGIPGDEASRLRSRPGGVKERSYFYLGEPEAVTPEEGLGSYRYRTEASDLYDITKDPLNFKTLARESNRMPWSSNFNPGTVEPGQFANDLERLVKEYGYKGFANPNAAFPMAVTFDPTQVERRATGGEVGDEAPYHQTPEFQNWFGDSVAHMDGVPVTYYHGTSKDKDFPSFNVGRHGVWLTSDPEEASQYAEQNDSQDYKYEGGKYIKTNTASRVIPVHLKAENPYLGEKPEELYQQQNYKKAQSDWFDGLRSQGYDSWIPASQNGALAVILKEPTQIKSIYNRKFDPKNKRMDKAVGGEAENPDIPQIDNAMSIFPKPQRMFPQDAPVAGGQYLNAATKEDMTGHKAAMASIGVQPGGKPYFRASPDSVDETGTPGRGSAITKTNLFKQKAGWKWAQAPEGHEATDTIVSVAHRGQHHYTLNAHFPKGVDLARYENSPTEPRLRPTTKGNVTFGPKVGSILVRGKEHPVYEHVIVKNTGGEVSGKKASGGHVATLRRMSDPAVNEAIRVINRSGSSPRDAVTLSKRLLGRQ